VYNTALQWINIKTCHWLSPNSITPTLQQSPRQVPNKVADLLQTQIVKVRNTNHVANFHDLCPRQVCAFVGNMSQTLSLTLSVHCNRLNSIKATQTGLSWTCHKLCRKYVDMSKWFVSATFMMYVHDFPRGKVLVKVGVMESGLYYICLKRLPHSQIIIALACPLTLFFTNYYKLFFIMYKKIRHQIHQPKLSPTQCKIIASTVMLTITFHMYVKVANW